jgi:hypothetical protein
MSDAEADHYVAVCRAYFAETGEVPQPHYRGICIVLTGRECADCAIALGEMFGVIGKMMRGSDKD